MLQRCIAGALGIQSSSVEVIELFEDARSARASLHLGAELQAITGFLVGKFRNVVDDASLVDSCANHGLDGVLGFSDVRELSLPPAPAIPIPSTGESGDGQSAKAQTTTTTTTRRASRISRPSGRGVPLLRPRAAALHGDLGSLADLGELRLHGSPVLGEG